ncbi:MAG: PAS domain S-box protein [Chloroflexota bacterium]
MKLYVEKEKRGLAGLILVFVVLVGGIAAAGYLYYRHYEQQYRLEVERQLSTIAALKVDELVQWRNERLGDAAVLYQNPAFTTLVQQYFENPADAQAQDRLQRWLEQLRAAYRYDRVFVLDAQGSERLAAPDTPEPVAPHLAQEIAASLHSGQVTFLDFHRDTAAGPIYLSVLAPILAGQEGSRPLGLLVLRIDPETYLYPFIQRWPVPSQTAETLLIRREGNEVLFLNELKFQKNAALALRIPLESIGTPAVRVALGSEGIVQGVDYRGAPVIAAVRAVPNSPWFLVARIDTAEVYAPLRARLWQIVIFFGALALTAGAAIVAVWRQQRIRFYRERYEVAEALRKSEERYHTLVEHASDGIFVADAGGKYVEVNPSGCAMLGYTRDEILAKRISDLIPAEDVAAVPLRLDELRRGKTLVTERRLIRKDGALLPVEISARMLPDGRFQAIQRDVTKRKRAEEHIKKLNRIYAVLSDINQAIVRIREPQALFEQVCRIAVETGGFRMTWINLVDESSPQVQVVAQVGGTDAYFEQADITLRGQPVAYCPIQIALRGEQHPTCHVVGHAAPCQNIAFQLGCRSVASFPLRVFDQIRGTVNFYAGEPDFFDAEELKLLDELALDLSFAMEFAEKETERQRAEQALWESEERYRTVAEFTYDWEYWRAPDGTFLYVSPSCERITGYSASVFFDDPGLMDRIVHPDDRAALEAHHAHTLAQDVTRTSVDFRIIRRDGKELWVNHSCLPVFDRAGKSLGRRGSNRDITERKRAEEALRWSEAFLDSIIEHSPHAMWIADDQGTLIRLNQACCDLLYITADEVVGKYNLFQDNIVEEQGFMPLVKQVFEQGQTVRFTLRYDSSRLKPIELAETSFVILDVTISPVLDEKGRVTNAIIQHVDITEREQAEEQLRQSEAALKQAQRVAHVGSWKWRIQSNRLEWSDEMYHIFGIEKETFSGELSEVIERAIHPDDRAAVEQANLSVIKDKKSVPLEYRVIWPDGTVRVVWAEAGELTLDDAGNPAFLTGIVQDITERKRAEEKMRESEERYRGLFEHMVEGYAYCQMIFEDGEAQDWIYLAVNDAFETLTGLKDVTGKRVSQVIPGIREADPGLFDIYARVSLSGQPEKFEIFVQALNMWFSVSVYSPEKEYFVAVFDVITERKRAEEALLASEARYRHTLDAMLEGCQIIGFDWRYLYLNDVADKHNRRPKQELLGQKYMEMWPGIESTEVFVVIRRGMEERLPQSMENEFTFPDGGKGWFELKIYPVPEGIVILSIDITERKRAEAEIFAAQTELQRLLAEARQSRRALLRVVEEQKKAEEEIRRLNVELEQRVAERTAELSDLYNNAPCGYHSLDGDGLFVRINDTELNWLGYTREEIIGKMKAPDLFTPASVETFGQNFPVFKARGWLENLELEMVRKDGSILPVLLSATAVADQAGRYLMSRSTMIDYTERKRAEAALRESQAKLEAANKELEAFAYSVSHDLRAPLRGIDGWSLALLEDYYEQLDETARQYLDYIRSETQRMGQLIDDLLQLSRVTRAEMQKSRVDLTGLAQTVAARLKEMQPERRVEVIIQPGLTAHGDARLLEVVLTNLFGNAWKFTGPRPQPCIEFGCLPPPPAGEGRQGSVYFVRDNGVGFDMTYAQKLFGAFQRMHKTSEFPGTGIGLATVQRIVHRHGGRVWAEAEVDGGATFYFTLEE